jgi:hypothetical protein
MRIFEALHLSLNGMLEFNNQCPRMICLDHLYILFYVVVVVVGL